MASHDLRTGSTKRDRQDHNICISHLSLMTYLTGIPDPKMTDLGSTDSSDLDLLKALRKSCAPT